MSRQITNEYICNTFDLQTPLGRYLASIFDDFEHSMQYDVNDVHTNTQLCELMFFVSDTESARQH